MSNKRNACAYPFMQEKSLKCDYEIESDYLVSVLGSILADETLPFYDDVHWLCTQVYHANGSIRGKLAITQEELKQIESMYDRYAKEYPCTMFVLPRGSKLACKFHEARCLAKRVVRIAEKINLEQEVAYELLEFLNILANLLFMMALAANVKAGIKEEEFISKSY